MSTVTVEGTFQTQTEMAVCVQVDEVDYWIPKSLIESADPDPDECERDDTIEVEIPEWFADKEGIA